MFTQVSWTNYILIVVLLSGCYYLIIGYLFYRHDLLQLISGKKIATNDVVTTSERYKPLVQFSDEVQALLTEAVRNRLDRINIIQSLQLLLKKYPELKDSASHESIQNLIINECKSYCSIHLSEEELGTLWN